MPDKCVSNRFYFGVKASELWGQPLTVFLSPPGDDGSRAETTSCDCKEAFCFCLIKNTWNVCARFPHYSLVNYTIDTQSVARVAFLFWSHFFSLVPDDETKESTHKGEKGDQVTAFIITIPSEKLHSMFGHLGTEKSLRCLCGRFTHSMSFYSR